MANISAVPPRYESVIAAMFKGMVQSEDRNAMALSTGINPDTGQKIPEGAYLTQFQVYKHRFPELAQNIARWTGAKLLALFQLQEGKSPCLIGGDGCDHQVNYLHVSGGQLMKHINEHILPRCNHFLPNHIFQEISDCTVREARVILSHTADPGSVQAVTHGYHAPRARRIFNEERLLSQHVEVLTLGDIEERVKRAQPYEQFLYDLVKAAAEGEGLDENEHGELFRQWQKDLSSEMEFAQHLVAVGEMSETYVRGEQRRERYLYKPLHRVSQWGEWLTRRAFNFEEYIAGKLRR